MSMEDSMTWHVRVTGADNKRGAKPQQKDTARGESEGDAECQFDTDLGADDRRDRTCGQRGSAVRVGSKAAVGGCVLLEMTGFDERFAAGRA